MLCVYSLAVTAAHGKQTRANFASGPRSTQITAEWKYQSHFMTFWLHLLREHVRDFATCVEPR